MSKEGWKEEKQFESLFLLGRSLGIERSGFYEKQQPARIFHP
jgi:hypothetical protein